MWKIWVLGKKCNTKYQTKNVNIQMWDLQWQKHAKYAAKYLKILNVEIKKICKY